jgi:hypothetical protein
MIRCSDWRSHVRRSQSNCIQKLSESQRTRGHDSITNHRTCSRIGHSFRTPLPCMRAAQVHAYDSKYRGLLMDAVNGSNVTVGSFSFEAGVPEPLFWEPTRCPGALAHTDADPKPFVVKMTYNAPPVGPTLNTLPLSDVAVMCPCDSSPLRHHRAHPPLQLCRSLY